MSIGYGIAVRESDDPYPSTVEVVFDGLAEAGVPGSFWVNLVPISEIHTKLVPGWRFPKRKAAFWKEAINAMAENPFRHAKELLKNETASPSAVASLIKRLPNENDPDRPMEKKLAQEVAFIAYAGGADTASDFVLRTNAIPGNDAIPRSAEENSSRNRCCRRPKSPARFSRSSFSAVY